MKELTIENLRVCEACDEGMEWITPLIEAGDIEAVKVALCNERPRWAQWAYKHEFDVLPLDESKRNGSVIVDSDLVFSQTAGDCSTQTAGDCSTQTAGYCSTQTAGEYSTQTAGEYSTQTAGEYSTQTAGEYSTQTAGEYSTQTAGGRSTQTAGGRSTQTAGDCSTQTAGGRSTQTAGGRSTQTAGGRSTQTAGDCSTQTAGYCSRHKAGMNSVFICRYYRSGVARVATMISVDDKFWTFNVETERWEHSSDQSEPE